MTRLAACTIGAAALIGSLLTAAPAFADPLPTCASLANPPLAQPASELVYIQAGDTQTNLLKQLGRKLRDNTAKPITLVFFTSGSCTNITAMYTQVPVTVNMTYIPSLLEDPLWTPSSAPLNCTVPTPGGQPLDVGNSAVFTASCTGIPAKPETVKLTTGPIQAYVLGVPESSSQTAITYEEAYFVFGYGAAGMIDPWVKVSNLWIRTVSKSTLLTWAANISVPANKFQGGCGSGGGAGSGCGASAQVVAGLQNNADPESAIGLLGDEVYDADRAFLNILAFRAKGQYAAYYPDKTASSRDKQNIRDGHYTVWSPTVWMYNINAATQAPTNPTAKYVVDRIDGVPVSPAPSFEPDTVVAGVGLVPDCAMHVAREFDGGPLSLYTPPASCTCTYEKTVATTSCATCSVATPCAGTAVCRNNLCEAN